MAGAILGGFGAGGVVGAFVAGAESHRHHRKVARLLGVLVAFVGMDVVTATPRFTFGIIELTDGVGIAYRKDWFEDPKEKAAFKKKYNYDLGVPQTWAQMRDIAEFFHRH